MDIQIPDSYDPDWQSKMLRKLSRLLDNLDDDALAEAKEIVEALREYSGH